MQRRLASVDLYQNSIINSYRGPIIKFIGAFSALSRPNAESSNVESANVASVTGFPF